MVLGKVITLEICEKFYNAISALESVENCIEESILEVMNKEKNKKKINEFLEQRDSSSENIRNLSSFYASTVKTYIDSGLQKEPRIFEIYVYLMIKSGQIREIRYQFNAWDFSYWGIFVNTKMYEYYNQEFNEMCELEDAFDSAREENLVSHSDFMNSLRDQMSSSSFS